MMNRATDIGPDAGWLYEQARAGVVTECEP